MNIQLGIAQLRTAAMSVKIWMFIVIIIIIIMMDLMMYTYMINMTGIQMVTAYTTGPTEEELLQKIKEMDG